MLYQLGHVGLALSHKQPGDTSSTMKPGMRIFQRIHSYTKVAPFIGVALKEGVNSRSREEGKRLMFQERGDIQNPEFQVVEGPGEVFLVRVD